MKHLSAILVVMVAAEAVACGLVLWERSRRIEPVLPTLAWDDPLVGGELALLAEQAKSGGSPQWLELGRALLGQGAYGCAEIAFREATQLDRTNYPAQFGHAFCLDRLGRVEESTEQYRKLVPLREHGGKLAQLGTQSLYAVGRNYLRLEQPAEAEQVFLQLTDYLPATHELAKLYIRSGKGVEALPLIESALKTVPRSLEFQFLLFRAESALGKETEADAAADSLERSAERVAIHFNTHYVTPFFNRYGLERKVTEYNKLIVSKGLDRLSETLNEILSHVTGRRSPYVRIALMGLLEVALQQKDPEKIRSRLEALGDFGEQNADMLQLEGAAASFTGNLSQALEYWNRAARMATNIQLEQRIAQGYQEQNNRQLHDEHLAKALLLEGITQFRNNEIAAAEKPLTKSLELYAGDAQAWYYLAEVQRLLGRTSVAEESYRRCLKMNPNHGRAIKRLAQLQKKS